MTALQEQESGKSRPPLLPEAIFESRRLDGDTRDARLQRMVILDWLLDSDPAIRWQVLRDLVHAPHEAVAAERARIATEGWGARLLALQSEDGQWAGGA